MIKSLPKEIAASSNVNAPIFTFKPYVRGEAYQNNGSNIDFVTDNGNLYVPVSDNTVAEKDAGHAKEDPGFMLLVSKGEQGEQGVKGEKGNDGKTPSVYARFDGKQMIFYTMEDIDGESVIRRIAATNDLTGPAWKPELVNDTIVWKKTKDDEAPRSIPLNELRADVTPILLRTNSDNTNRQDLTSGPANYIQWKYEGQDYWNNLISISELMNLTLAGIKIFPVVNEETGETEYHLGHKEVLKATYDSTHTGKQIISTVELGETLFDAGPIPFPEYNYEYDIEWLKAENCERKNEIRALQRELPKYVKIENLKFEVRPENGVRNLYFSVNGGQTWTLVSEPTCVCNHETPTPTPPPVEECIISNLAINMVLRGNNSELFIGQSVDFNATYNTEGDCNDYTIQWSIDEPSIASIQSNNDECTVTGISAGQTTLHATINGVTEDMPIVVKDPCAINNLIIVPGESLPDATGLNSITVREGECDGYELRYDTIGECYTDFEVSWDTENHNIATVDNEGTICGVNTGETTVTATVNGTPISIPVEVIPAITLTVNPKTLEFASTSAGAQNVTVTTNDSDFTYLNSCSWITITRNQNTLQVNTTANTGSARSCTVTVISNNSNASDTFTVSQAAFTPTLTINPSTLSYTNVGGSKTFTVTTNLDSYTVSENCDWVTTSKSDNVVTVTIGENSNSNSRQCTITVTSEGITANVTVNQAGAEVDPCEVVSLEMGYGTELRGGLLEKHVDVQDGNNIQLTLNYEVADPENCQSEPTIRWYSDNSNIASVNESGWVTGNAPGETRIHVEVGGLTDYCDVTVTRNTWVNADPASLNFTASDNSTKTITVTTSYDDDFTVSSDCDWVHVTKNNDYTVSVTVDPNTGDARQCKYIRILNVNSNEQWSSVTVNQEAVAEPTSYKLYIDNGNTANSITVNTQPFSEYMEITEGTPVTVNATRTNYTATAYKDSNTNAVLSMPFTMPSNDYHIKIVWTANPTLTVNPTTFTMDPIAGGGKCDVTTNAGNFTVTSNCNPAWAVFSRNTNDNDGFLFSVEENNTGSPRTCTLTVSAGNATPVDVTINQNCYYTLTVNGNGADSVKVSGPGLTGNATYTTPMQVYGGNDYTVTATKSGSTPTYKNHATNATVTFPLTINENTTIDVIWDTPTPTTYTVTSSTNGSCTGTNAPEHVYISTTDGDFSGNLTSISNLSGTNTIYVQATKTGKVAKTWSETVTGATTITLDSSDTPGCAWTDTTVPVTSVTISSPLDNNVDNNSIEYGACVGTQTVTLTATVNPNNATDQTVTWSLSNTASSIATINSSTGVVTIVGIGTVNVVATAGGVSSSTYTFTITPAAIHTITLDDDHLDLNVGDEETLHLLGWTNRCASQPTITWSSSDSNVASVDANGKVTGVGAGSAVITASAGNDITDDCSVDVTGPTQCYESFRHSTVYNDTIDSDVAGTYSVTIPIIGNEGTGGPIIHNVEGYQKGTVVDTGGMINRWEVNEFGNENLGTGSVEVWFNKNISPNRKEAHLTVTGVGVCSGEPYSTTIDFEQLAASVVQGITEITGVTEGEENWIGENGIQLGVTYSPTTAIEQSKGVTWNITGRSASYFSITSGGLLTCSNTNLNGGEITITATSTYDNTISKSVTINVTYGSPLE